MLNTTTHNIDGKEIKEYLGVVNGDTISELGVIYKNVGIYLEGV